MATLTQTYDRAGEVDLRGFSGSLAAYAVSVSILLAAAASRGRRLPERYAVADVVLGGLAVHKFTRIVSKSSVVSPVRAPFTEFEEAAGSGEHVESPRGHHGVRHAVGELITCPFCLGVWVSTAYVATLTLADRPARAWAALFAVNAVSDALQHGYERLRES